MRPLAFQNHDPVRTHRDMGTGGGPQGEECGFLVSFLYYYYIYFLGFFFFFCLFFGGGGWFEMSLLQSFQQVLSLENKNNQIKIK